MMTDRTKEIFQEEVSDWLQLIIEEPDLLGLDTIILQTVEQVRHRKLQSELYSSILMRLNVEGIEKGVDITTNSDFERKVNLSFDTYSDTLVTRLQERGQGTPYFYRISTIESIRGDIDGISFPVDPIGGGSNNNGGSSNTQNTTPIIIAAAASVGAVILFALAVYVFVNRRRRQDNGKDFDTGSTFEGHSPQSANEYPEKDERWDYEQSQMIPARIASQRHANEDNVTESGNTYSTLDRLYADNASYQSYGYSLEDGIGGSKHTLSPSPVAERPAPMEVDMYGLQRQARYNFAEHDDDTIEVSIGSPGSTYSGLTDLGTQASFEGGGRGNRTLLGGERMSPNTNNLEKKPPLSPTRNTNKAYQRDCVAPPGKLGVVIDTTKHGPVVHMVKEGSPLEHVVFPGDKILSIDEVDTRGMTASGVTRVMAKKMHNQRTITVSSTQKSQFL